ncbi:MAG: chemotaxis protein CheW [Burkholderiales bacterium]|mgnify:CR=1 FL=1|nr:MAG: chemotaxis protein CheW [Pseudomonadota bacterium]MCL4702992.1 chemotaxis protein CheW [Burkholderiaceae bacterium]MCZ2415101.1 chemotaxis protein CheW [Burkholderiales bacterium]MEB2336201.1 chemotaxis protein CheW [Burkholderiales bacterium]
MADRKHLRDFQARLSERLRQAAAEPVQAARLGVQAGGRRFLVELSEAGEIAACGAAVTPVPLTQDWFMGLVNLRGSLFGVSDLARFAGGGFTPNTKETRLVAFAPRLNLNGAILVDRMLGLQNLSTMTEAEDDGDEAAGQPWLGRAWIDEQGHRWTELSLERLAGDERFLAVSR